jgi:hypothetical protein
MNPQRMTRFFSLMGVISFERFAYFWDTMIDADSQWLETRKRPE